ncbi:MAG TPA: TIGR04053 family radical SAM/SPASM domain-containing protein [Terriglobales bacterium]|nr:TIGR04053 family radical SAM/SPASM domain-containing protein [Terriglobales bacterium]
MATPRTLDFNEKPYIVIWETTQACDLACVHCRACAQPQRNRFELSTAEAKGLIGQIAEMKVPVFVLTGGDPLKRPDIHELVQYAHQRGVHTSMTPSATPLLTKAAIAKLKEDGLARLAVSLDGSTAEIHDAFRRVPGSYQWTLDAVRWARELGLPVQINTTITRRNLDDFEAMVRLLEKLDIVLWSVFFLVPTGRGQTADLVTAEGFEMIFEKLYQTSARVKFDIKTTEAQHYRRFLLQRRVEERRQGPASARTSVAAAQAFPAALGGDGIARAPRGLNDGKGFVFVSHVGEVFPSGFLPLAAGNIRKQRLADLYRESPLFRMLRDTSQLNGKCGVCEFKEICGGSRARAYALTGDVMAEEPCCVYQPGRSAQKAEPALVGGNRASIGRCNPLTEGV